MNINVTTKFNIGDTVHTIYHYEEYWCVEHDEFIVQEIRIARSLSGTYIIYVLKNGAYSTQCPEEYCFDSYDSAKAWCLQKNDDA